MPIRIMKSSTEAEQNLTDKRKDSLFVRFVMKRLKLCPIIV